MDHNLSLCFLVFVEHLKICHFMGPLGENAQNQIESSESKFKSVYFRGTFSVEESRPVRLHNTEQERNHLL